VNDPDRRLAFLTRDCPAAIEALDEAAQPAFKGPGCGHSPRDEEKRATSPDMRALPPLLLLVASLMATPPARAQLTIELSVPDDTPEGAVVYVAGSFNDWNPAEPAYRLVARAPGARTITLPESVRGPVSFKFTLGSWERVEVDASGGDVPNRTFTIPAEGAAAWSGTVARWRDPESVPPPASTAAPTVSILDTAFAMPQLGRARRIWIYVPPDYETSEKRYPVFYFHDGQNVFDAATSFAGEWGVDETLDRLHADGDGGAIVVAIDHGGATRLDEYSPWVNPEYGGGEGEAYLAFIMKTLKPYVDAHYRTLPDRLSTGIAGSSMGGLISLYAVLRHPDVFGRAGVFSPALWFAPEVFDLARAAGPPRPGTRLYFVSGAREVGPGDTTATYVHDQIRMIEVLALVGFVPGREVLSVIREEGEHAEWFWRREYPKAYLWLFRPEDQTVTDP